MNVYELIDDLYHAHSHLSAGDDGDWPYMPVRQMLDAYDALAPDWSNAPDDAVCYAIDANGEANWFNTDVQVTRNASFWGALMDRDNDAGFVELRDGIDWRLCKWSREVTA